MNLLIGIICSASLFLFLFLLVHGIRLALLGYKALRKKEEPAPPKPQEPVYYIVEKKKRPKTKYSEPKPFRFDK